MMGIRNFRINPLLTAIAMVLMAASPLYRGHDGVHEYRPVPRREESIPLLPYHVPDDGSVSLKDCWLAEGGPQSGMSLEAYRDLVSRKMLPGHEILFDAEGDIIKAYRDVWDPNTRTERQCEVNIDPNEWPGGLPKGRWVDVPDIDGNGQGGPLDKLHGTEREVTIRAQRMFRQMNDHLERKDIQTCPVTGRKAIGHGERYENE